MFELRLVRATVFYLNERTLIASLLFALCFVVVVVELDTVASN